MLAHDYRLYRISRTRTWLTGLCLAICLACPLIAAHLTLDARAGAAERAAWALSERADRLERQVDSDLAVFDLALKAAARETPATGRLPVLDHPLAARYIAFVNQLNEFGDVIADSRPGPVRPQNFAGRDYFVWHRQNPADGLFAGHPFGPTADLPASTIPLSRRLSAPDGGFAGVAIAGIRLAWLRALLADPSPGPGAIATIRRDDGKILMRAPFNADDIGRSDPADTAWRDWTRTHVSLGETAGSLYLVRPIGGASGLLLELTVPRDSLVPGPAAWETPLLALPPGLCALALAVRLRQTRRRAGAAKIAAQAEASERMHLLASMSHELRTPLSGVIGQADLMRCEGGLSHAQAERLERMIEAGMAMRVIVDRTIDFARPGNHTVEPVLANCALDNLIRSCRAIVEADAKAKNLALITLVDPAVPPVAKLDRVLVFEALINHLRNAVKYTDRGSVTLRLSRAAAGAGVPDGLRFEIADTGPGVAPSLCARLFQPYDRLDVGPSACEGNGLGLSITREIVARLGGRTGHRDNPGGGSVFWVELPFVPPDKDVPRAAPEPPPRAPLRILVADDQPVTRTVTADYLRSAGHTVTEVEDGEAAVAAVRCESFDMLLTDMRMPGWDGLETARRVRALPGDRNKMPIVLVTADLAARSRAAAGDARIDLCLMKPFTRRELLAAVETVAALLPSERTEPVLDEEILAELRAAMGPDTLDANLRTASQRIEHFLMRLDRREEEGGPDLDPTIHDLTGIVGVLGLKELSACLRRADPARPADAAMLRDVAARAVAAIARRSPPQGEPDNDRPEGRVAALQRRPWPVGQACSGAAVPAGYSHAFAARETR